MDENKKYCGKCGNILGDNGYCVRCGYNNNQNMNNEIIAEDEKKYKKPPISSTILLIINILGALWIVPLYSISFVVYIFVSPLAKDDHFVVNLLALGISLICSGTSFFCALSNYEKKGERTSSTIIITIIAYVLVFVLGNLIG